MQLTKCSTNTVVYRLTAEKTDEEHYKCRWADFILEFDFRRLSIQSDLGNFTCKWGHSDTCSLLNLLSNIDKDYLMSKISVINFFDIDASKEALISMINSDAEKYGIDNIDKCIETMSKFPKHVSRESYIYRIKNVIPRIDSQSIPIITHYPPDVIAICDMFIKYVQPQIKNDLKLKQKEICVYYTGDNEPSAIDEVRTTLQNMDGIIVSSLVTIDSERACRNAYGKQMSDTQFELLNGDDDWFDDYDFTMKAVIETDLSIQELIDACNDSGLCVSSMGNESENERIKNGDIVKHFKNEMHSNEYIYKVINMNAKETTGGTRVVVYESLYETSTVHKGDVFVRPYDEFMSEVDKAKYPNIIQRYRFDIV